MRASSLALSLVLAVGCSKSSNKADLAVSDDLAVADLSSTISPDLASAPDLEPGADLAGCTMCGSACLELDRDPNNCGACGHVCGCGSTSCTNGVCDAQVLAPAQKGPYSLFVDAGGVYFSTDGDMTVSRIAPTGGTPTPLLVGLTNVRGIAADPTSLYLARFTFNVVEIMPRTGTSVMDFSNAQEPGASGIVSDGTTLFWGDQGSGNLRSKAIGSSTLQAATSVEPGQSGISQVAVDDTYVYWTTNVVGMGAVLRALKTGGTVTAIATAQDQPLGLAVDATNVYWANQHDGTINMRPKDGSGSITQIKTGLSSPAFVAVDATAVYFTEQAGGRVWRAPLAGGAPTPIAIDQNGPLTLALDNACVYFVERGSGSAADGAIRRAGKQ